MISIQKTSPTKSVIPLKKSDIPDPKPSLPGPPTLSLNGGKIKPPSVDNPNLKLPTGEAKALDPTKAQTATSAGGLISAASTAASLTPTGIAANAALNAAGGGGGGLNACSDISSRIEGLDLNVSSLNPSGMIPDGIGLNWSPNKFNPTDLFNPPKIPPLPNIPSCPALDGAQQKLDSLKNSFPQPKVPQSPAVPRVSVVKL